MKEHEKDELKKKELKQDIKDPFQTKSPRDGFDNTGTQGYDSLKDDGYRGTKKGPAKDGEQDGTGSSSEDFDEWNPDKNTKESDEDHALDSGI